MVAGLIHLVGKVFWNAVIVLVCASLIFIGYKANQPMTVVGAPKGMTYAEFIQDRLDAAKTVKPSQCGWGMMLTLAAIGPTYSVVYTSVGVNPNGFLAKVTAPDSDIPKGVAGAQWYDVPRIWWSVVEHISWTMLGKPHPFGCKFRTVG
jgi:hypothetical protein